MIDLQEVKECPEKFAGTRCYQTAVLQALACIAIEVGEPTEPPPPLPTCSIDSYCGPNDTIICKKLCVGSDGIEVESEVDTGVDCSIPIQDPQFQLICNGVTGFYDEVVNIYSQEDGSLLAGPLVSPTTFPCPLDETVECFIVCAVDDDRALWVKKSSTGVITIFESDGTTPAPAGTLWKWCTTKNYIQTEDCYELIADPEVQFKAILCVNKQDPTDTYTIWLDSAGTVIEAPTGVQKCEEQVLPIEECCIAEDVSDVDRWCQNFKFSFPGGNGDANTTISVGVSGVYENLPNTYTQADLLAALNTLDPAAGWSIDSAGRLCRTTPGPGIVLRTRRCNTGGQVLLCQLSAVTAAQLFVAGAEPVCKNFVRTWGKYEEPIADDLALIADILSELNQKKTFKKWCDQPIENGLDNTFTDFNDTNQIIKLVKTDGTTGQILIPSATSFSDQIIQFAAGVAACLTHAKNVQAYCTTGCGGLPEPLINLPKMKFRYAGWQICQGEVNIASATYCSDQVKKPIPLDLDSVKTPLRVFEECKNWDTGETIWCSPEGENVPPICPKPCEVPFPELPEDPCTYISKEVCEFLYADPQEGGDPTVNTEGITLQYQVCGATVTLQGAYTLDASGAVILHTLDPSGYYGDCDTGLPVEPPIPECPEGVIFEPVIIGGSYFIEDNSNWIGAPTPHITNGFNFEFTYTFDDGSTTVVQQTADPLYVNMLSEIPAQLGCKAVPVCANHTSPKGCNAIHVANLAMYPAYNAPTFPADSSNTLTNPDQAELWATGWLIDCDDCSKKVTRVEITNSNDPAYIGAFKEPTVYDKEKETIFRAVTCEGVFWKDCDGNNTVGPADPCCVSPVAQEVCFKDELIQECNTSELIPDANYDGAIQWVNGRPNTNATWELIDNRDPLNQVVVATGANFNEFIDNMEALGYQEWSFGEAHFFCPCPPGLENAGDYFITADGNTVSKPACRPLGEVPIPPAKPAQDGEIEKSLRVSLDSCTLKELLDGLGDCEACAPIVETDAVCNDDAQIVDDVTIEAGQPIIRKSVTFFVKEGCECIETGTAVRFFDFNSPAVEFTSPVAFSAICDFEASTITRCDRNGTEIQVTSITVNTPDGGITQTTFADANGDPIPEPLLPLSICNPQVQEIKGCIVNADGSQEQGILHLQYDNVGSPGYDVSLFTSNTTGGTSQVGARKFICKDGPTENCPVELNEHCYDVSGFSFACPTSTIEINGEEVDLCGSGGTSVIPSSGDLCTVGGVRSNTTGDRCRTAYPEPTTDPAGLAAELQGFGSFGDELVNPNVGTGGFTTSNFYMAVRGTFPSLVGTTAATLDITTTWEVGSGISIHAYDCATDTDLSLVSGTPTTYAPDAACSDGSRGPIDSWGAANNAMTQATVFDTSGVADLGNVIFYSIVLNPPGDALKDVTVAGLTPGGSCDVTDVTTLSQILGEVTGTPWTVNGNIICTKTSDTLGTLTCGTTAALPTITDCTVDREVPLVKLACNECVSVQLKSYCVQSKGSVATIKEVKSVRSKTLTAKVAETKVKESETKPGKIVEVCEERRYNCDGEHLGSTYLYQGKQIDQATFEKLGLTVVSCDSPEVSYTPGAVTCATEERFVEGVLTQVVLNCTEFINDADPADLFVQYTLADSYTGLGAIGDIYQPTGDPIACPPGSITENKDCYAAVSGIKGVANAGDTVEQCAVSNAIAGTTFYTITLTSSQSVLYTGTDPVAGGFDFGNAAVWNGPVACDPEVVAVGDEIPVGYECVDGLPHLMIAIRDSSGLIIGDRSIESTVAGVCHCCDEKCAQTACILMDAFDYDRGLVTVGQTTQFEILLDGINQATIVHDYTTTSDGINVSSYYTPILAAINAVAGWSISLDTDVLQSAQGKPTWRVEYTGSSPSTLVINQGNGGSILTLNADGAGAITGTTNWGVDSPPFAAC